MRSVLWVGLTVIFAVAMFWVGLITHFPGAAFSRYVESQVNRDPRIVVRLTPAEMSWNRLRIPRISIQSTLPEAPGPWIALKDTEIPISLGLIGATRATSGVGSSGRIDLVWDDGEQSMAFELRDVELDDIPALANLGAGEIGGRLRASGTLRPGEALPEGRVEGRIEDLTVSEAVAMGLTVPPLQLVETRFAFALGPAIQVEELSLAGDLAGQITGTLTPRPRQLRDSRMDLQVDLVPSPEWIAQWGDLAPLLEGSLSNGRLAGRLVGTPARPNFRRGR